MKKVLLGMSGGVDSTVSALLLKEQGYEVIGVTFKFIEMDTKELEDICKSLDIKLYIYDYIELFKKEIIDKFIEDYKNGITPNPCALCNKKMKLKLLYEKSIELYCDYISTGHYAKVDEKGFSLSKDQNKDQTYFMCCVDKEILSKLITPLNNLTKKEVREIAKKNNLINHNKKDSLDVCFINDSFKNFINKNINNKQGNIINLDNDEIIGKHKGLSYYTIGQRKGLNIGGYKNKMYVVGKNIEKNILYVSTKEDNEYLISTSCIIKDVNMLVKEKVNKCKAKFRYRQELIDVELKYLSDNKIEVIYNNGVKAVTIGQVCCLYKDNYCIGGGIIDEIKKNNETIWYM